MSGIIGSFAAPPSASIQRDGKDGSVQIASRACGTGLFPRDIFQRSRSGRWFASALGDVSVFIGTSSCMQGKAKTGLEQPIRKFVSANLEKPEKNRTDAETKKRQKPRNHPANPIGGPDLPCITLPGVFRSVSKGTLDRTEHRTLFTFSHFWTAVAVRRRPADGSGTLCLCKYYTTHFSDVKLVWPNFLKKV